MSHDVLYSLVSSPLWVVLAYAVAVIGIVAGLVQRHLFWPVMGVIWSQGLLDAESIIPYASMVDPRLFPVIVALLLLLDFFILVIIKKKTRFFQRVAPKG